MISMNTSEFVWGTNGAFLGMEDAYQNVKLEDGEEIESIVFNQKDVCKITILTVQTNTLTTYYLKQSPDGKFEPERAIVCNRVIRRKEIQ